MAPVSRELLRYIATRFVQLVLIVVIAVSINFLIPRLLPGDPIESLHSRGCSRAAARRRSISQALIESYRAKYGLDQPLIWRNTSTTGATCSRFDLGVSLSSLSARRSRSMIRSALPWSVGLLAVATLIAFASARCSARGWPGRGAGGCIRTLVPLLMVLTSIPFYLLAIILIYFFAVVLKWLFPPAGGVDPTRIMRFDLGDALDILHHAILPASPSSSAASGFWALGMRSQMVSVLGEDYITFAEAKGLPPRRIFLWYGMRNALLPQVTALALSLGLGRLGRGPGRGDLQLSGPRRAALRRRSAARTTSSSRASC